MPGNRLFFGDHPSKFINGFKEIILYETTSITHTL